MSLELDIKAPSWNTCYRIANNRMYKTVEARAFQDIIAYAYKGELYEGDVEVFIEFHRSPLIDVDNVCKMILDALEGKAYNNDRQVVSLTVDRQKCKKGEDWLYVNVEER